MSVNELLVISVDLIIIIFQILKSKLAYFLSKFSSISLFSHPFIPLAFKIARLSNFETALSLKRAQAFRYFLLTLDHSIYALPISPIILARQGFERLYLEMN